MKVSKLTIGRLYNLGNYEHVRYDITVELQPGESATRALIGLEKIVQGLAPEKTVGVCSKDSLERQKIHIVELRKSLRNLGPDEFKRRQGFFEGTPREYIQRVYEGYLKDAKKRARWERKAAKARALLDSLGGAAKWKDAKLDWEDYHDDDL